MARHTGDNNPRRSWLCHQGRENRHNSRYVDRGELLPAPPCSGDDAALLARDLLARTELPAEDSAAAPQ